ncbi:MAG: Rne/Rng family ribonuclease [Bacteroidales bacterium]|nr:Rne/Rng family ribonuclease [Bacteroidales bacterium]NLK80962.1 Rne/Rng family ribonuclease [Bacteroidales bacterium]HPY82406.1 Rne/Rng family ribonuclease [Bacteroidales bacterium]
MNKEIIIRSQESNIDIALVENNHLVELIRNQTDTPQFSVGDIYIAKVKKVISGLNAVFVDLGYEKDAFLHYHDLGPQFSSLSALLKDLIGTKPIKAFEKNERLADIDKNGNIAEVLESGQHILVQISKEPISTKGPRLCSEISIAGRNIVLLPFSNKVSISQKIETPEEKARLKRIVRALIPPNYGVIVRTAAEGSTITDIELEIQELVKKWENALRKIRKFKNQTPHLIVSEISRTSALLRDIFTVEFNNILTNDAELKDELQEYITTIAPERAKIVKLYTATPPIFEQFGIERQIKSSFGQTVPVKNGAYLIIEKTEALHVIDVNSGNRTKFEKDQESNAFDVNKHAAIEIARQIRLRDLGGIIIVDFIDMRTTDNKQKLFETLKEAMSHDRAKHNILPLSKFGLMQITRQRVRPELKLNTNEVCPTCNGSGNISPSINIMHQIEHDLRHITKVLKIKHLTIKAHPFIAGYISKGVFSLLQKWKFLYSFSIRTHAMSSYNFLEYTYHTKDGKKIIL